MFAEATDLADRLVDEFGVRRFIVAVWAQTRAYPTPGGKRRAIAFRRAKSERRGLRSPGFHLAATAFSAHP